MIDESTPTASSLSTMVGEGLNSSTDVSKVEIYTVVVEDEDFQGQHATRTRRNTHGRTVGRSQEKG